MPFPQSFTSPRRAWRASSRTGAFTSTARSFSSAITGLAYFSEMTKWLAILHGTRFALPEEKAEILNSYYRHGLRWVLFDRQMDFSACGRQINGGQVRAKYRSVTGTAARLNRVLGRPAPGDGE